MNFMKMNDKIKYMFLSLFGERIFSKIRAVYWAERLKKNKFYEKEVALLPTFVHPGDVCIDIGANFGQYTYPLSKLVGPTGRVFSFEPLSYNFEILKNIVKKLKLVNVEIEKLALGNENGETEIITPVNNWGVLNIAESYLGNQRENKNEEREMIRIATLDRLRFTHPLWNKVKFVKCDTEGAELMVFKGGKDFLRSVHPTILCEIEERHTNRYNYTPEELVDFLKGFDYEIFNFISGELVPIKKVQKTSMNYIFIYKNF